MVITQQEKDKTLNELHFNLHIQRRLNSKPTNYEVQTSVSISSLFESECPECKQVMDQKRQLADIQMKGGMMNQNKSFLEKVLGK
jgi:hypothetical protein